MATFFNSSPRLACARADWLVMRHDKEAFAKDAIERARIDKLVGDYERTILFTAYARSLSNGKIALKNHLDPFTGCFISAIPVTVTLMRFALRTIRFFEEGSPDDGDTFARTGIRRIGSALRLASSSELADTFDEERRGWDTYYDVIEAVDKALQAGDLFALDLQRRTRKLVGEIVITAP